MFGLLISRAVIVWAFVNGLQIAFFPLKERGLAIGAPVFGNGTMTFAQLEKRLADFAAKLRLFLAIVKIKIVGWSLTMWACC